MNIVGIITPDEVLFRASSFNTADEKERAKQVIQIDADSQNYTLRFEDMTDEQIRSFTSQ